MQRVALVYPYFRTKSPTELLFPPLGVASLSSQLHAYGIENKIFDCTFETHSNILNKLKDYKPDIVGIHSMVTLSRNTYYLAESIRSGFPDTLLVAGGPLPTLYPERFNVVFDIVFRGEADLSFPRFCRDYFGQKATITTLNKLPLDTYAGLFIQKGEIQTENPVVYHSEKELASFPLPNRADFDHTAYQNVWQQQDGSKTTSIITTLGCPFNCDFCSRPIFGNLFRRRNLDFVFAEIDQIQKLGYDSLWIADDNFTLDSSFSKEFCLRIGDLKIKWSCLSRVTGITEEIARLMRSSGCRRVYLGLETGNQATLDLMKKKATLEDGKNAVHLFHKAGIEVAAFFIVGYPGETVQAIEDTFRFALELPFSDISFNVPYPLPGSQLYERVSKVDKNKDWKEENEITFVYESEFDAGWLKRRINETMLSFSHKSKK